MESIQLFIELMKKHCDVPLDERKISVESTELYQDEIDEKLIPTDHLKCLPDPILFETLLYEDEMGMEWLAGIAINPITRKREYIVLILNDKPIVHQFL